MDNLIDKLISAVFLGAFVSVAHAQVIQNTPAQDSMVTSESSLFSQGSWYYGLSGGVGTSQPAHIDTINIPSGNQNTYSSNRGSDSVWMLGLSGGYTFPIAHKFNLALGFEADYLNFGKITGTLHPLTNISPSFDTLNYSYKAKSYTLMADLKLQWLYTDKLFLNVFGALGPAWNEVSNYSETVPSGSSAFPSPFPFENKTSTHFAFSIGAGVGYRIIQGATVELGYSYFNLGKGELASTATSLNAPTTGPLETHMLYVSLIF